MKDKFVLKYSQAASKAEQQRSSGGTNAKHINSTKHTLLHDHRASDALLDYLDDLE
jgi:hypothetical protein